MDEVCVWCGEDVGHEPDCPQVVMDAMQQHIEELTEERDSLSSKLEKCEAERAKYERWFYEKFGQAFEAEEDLDALLEANRGLQAKLDRYDRYEQLLATAYQLAGLVGAPVRFLDAYALHDDVDPDSLLPVTLDELDEFKALTSRLGAVEDELRHSVSVISIVRSWLLENVRGSTHWENCEREHATCRAIRHLGGVVERLSRLDLTAGVVERREPEIGDPVSWHWSHFQC